MVPGFNALICQHIAPLKTEPPHNQKKNSLPLCHCLCHRCHCCHCPCHCDYTIAIAISLSLNFIMPWPRSSSGSHDLICQSVGFNSTTPLLLATQDWHLPKMWTDGNEDRGGRYKEANVHRNHICLQFWVRLELLLKSKNTFPMASMMTKVMVWQWEDQARECE